MNPVLRRRIDEAIRRIQNDGAYMRIPAEKGDPDLVLSDCSDEIDRLTKDLMEAHTIITAREGLFNTQLDAYEILKQEHGELSRLLKLITSEFRSDPQSVQCFDLDSIVKPAIALVKKLEKR